ncbi:MAG: electron transfer flavoprotein subunit beta/FixA family protein [Bacteroidales bacterium]|nr:electron transfer flavoprotein subunit beta/FixA family protein [Bacteroidales bacterium]
MKALVCIGHVPDTTSKIRFTDDDKKFDTTDIQYIIGPYEELALTRLLDIKDSGTDVHITAVNVGPVETEATLRKALAMGADEAVRVNAEPADAVFVAKQIAEVFKNGEYDVIVTGKESIDYNGSQVEGMIAEFIGLPSVSGASLFEIDGDKVKMEQEIEGGKQVLDATFPFVVSAGKGFALEPRIPNMRGIMMARRKKLDVVEPVEQNNMTEVVKHYLPEAKPQCKMVDPENVEELVRLLHEEAKII